jgi:alpha-mannosidase
MCSSTTSECLRVLSQDLTRQSWTELGLKPNPDYITIFNPLSFTNDVLVTCEVPGDATGVQGVASSLHVEDSRRQLIFVAPRLPPFGFREFHLERRAAMVMPPFSAGTNSLEGPFYRLRVDPRSGGLSSLIHKASGQELVISDSGRALCQTVYYDGQERLMTDVQCQPQIDGVRGALRVTGRIGDLCVTNLITLHATLDRVDFDVQIEKPSTTNEQRLMHFFPVGNGARDMYVETTAAVIRPAPQPEGDLLPGADTRRFAVQGFVDASPAGRVGVTIAPLDAFMLRLDQGALAFEALGNDQNWKEVTQDQDGARHFRFRYSLRAHAPGYDNASALAWSRSMAAPATLASGRLPKKWLDRAHLAVDPARAFVTCWKPSDDGASGQAIVRLWETGGQSAPVLLSIRDYHGANETDLLERKQGALKIEDGRVAIPVRGHGISGVALER